MEKITSKNKTIKQSKSKKESEIILILTVKRKNYRLIVSKGEDLLLALDNFLKKNKIDLSKEKFKLELSFNKTGLISQRVAQAIVKGIIIAKEWL